MTAVRATKSMIAGDRQAALAGRAMQAVLQVHGGGSAPRCCSFPREARLTLFLVGTDTLLKVFGLTHFRDRLADRHHTLDRADWHDFIYKPFQRADHQRSGLQNLLGHPQPLGLVLAVGHDAIDETDLVGAAR